MKVASGSEGAGIFGFPEIARESTSSAKALGIEKMSERCVQGRAVMIDLHAHLGRERVRVGYDLLMDILKKDQVVVEPGDMVCLHTGFAQMLLEMNKQPDPHAVENACAVLEGRDERLLQWITDSGLVALIADNYAVEGLPASPRPGSSELARSRTRTRVARSIAARAAGVTRSVHAIVDGPRAYTCVSA